MSKKYILNTTIINNFYSIYGNTVSKKLVTKCVVELHRKQHIILEDDVPKLCHQGSKIVPKLCSATSFTTDLYSQNYLKMILGALYFYIDQEHKDILHDADSLIFFELFDGEENLLYSPMDLLNPISLDYESEKYWFYRRNNYAAVNRCEFTDDKKQKFVLAKTQTNFRTPIDRIATSVDIYRIRVKTNSTDFYDDLDYLSLQSIYSDYSENSTYIMSESIPCAGNEKSFLFLSHINNE